MESLHSPGHTGGAAGAPEVVDRDDTDVVRATVYLLLATLLRTEPTPRLLTDLARLQADDTALGRVRGDLAVAAAATTAEAAAREYQAVFVGVGRGEVLPYGSYYLTGFLNERPLARVRRAMKELGVRRAAGVFEPEDHLGSMCEVMAALLSGAVDQPASAADRFYSKHLAPWAARACGDIAVAPSARLYRAVGLFGLTWFELESEALALATTAPRPAATAH
jgi:TorA maturation chaperone TorD